MRRLFMTFFIALFFLSFLGSADAALLTFDDVIDGQTSYEFDGDGDGINDGIFTTEDPLGFFSYGPGPNMIYINEPGLGVDSALSELTPELRVDFYVGAVNSLSFGFALSRESEENAVTFSVYDASQNLLVSATEPGISGPGDFPEGYVDVTFNGMASYAEFNFSPLHSSYIIDNFEGIFGSSEIDPVPEPATLLLIGAGLLGVVSVKRRKKI